jgi:uncharacterized alkaline shock family protein YloU
MNEANAEPSQTETGQQGQTGEGEMNMGQQESVVAQQQTGKTTIADSVVAKIANIAAREVPGVHALGGATERAVSGAISKITGAGGRSTGIDVQVGQEEAAVDVAMIVDYGQSIPDVADNVRQNIMNQVNAFTGLRVKEVNISVNDLYFPGEGGQQEQGEQHEESSVR